MCWSLAGAKRNQWFKTSIPVAVLVRAEPSQMGHGDLVRLYPLRVGGACQQPPHQHYERRMRLPRVKTKSAKSPMPSMASTAVSKRAPQP